MKLLNLSLVFLLLVTLLTNNSCTVCSCKTVDCPAFNEPALDQWINAMDSSTLLFQSSSSQIDTLVLGKIQRSGPTQVSTGCMHSATGCNANLWFYDAQPASTAPKFALYFQSFTGWDNKTTKEFSITYQDLIIKGTGVTDTGFVTSTPGIQTLFTPTISLNGKSFSNVQMINADPSSIASGIARIYFAKNVGFVAYEKYPSHQLWVKQ